jgi:hypothetical protein
MITFRTSKHMHNAEQLHTPCRPLYSDVGIVCIIIGVPPYIKVEACTSVMPLTAAAAVGGHDQLVKDLRHLLLKPYLPLGKWGSYALQLSIDGHGTASRLPLQYLQGTSVVLKMQSPYQDW